MNAARSTFRSVYLLLLNRGTVLTEAPAASKRIPALPPLLPTRSVSQFFKAMATSNAGEKSTNNNSIGNMEGSRKTKAKQNEPLRKTKSKLMRLKSAEVRSPTTVYVQVVGAGSRDTSASIFVFSEFNRYLFNCGEGTQRLMMEYKLKPASLDNIFLTRLSWENVGGLSGMILTLKDNRVTEFVLSGPPKLESYLRAIKSFSGPLDNIRLTVNPYTDNTYSDETMTVTQVPVFARPNSPTNSTQTSSRTDDELKATRGPSMVVAYICKLHPKMGNFLVAEAKELGLPVGTAAIRPLIVALKAGQSVEFEGKQIRPEQVCTPPEPGPVFLVVECPSEEFIPGVCTNQQLQRHASGTEDPAALVVHFTPESVLGSEPYQRWMESFPSSTKHLILNEHASGVHYIRSYKLQTQLHMVHPEVFPLLQDYRTREPQAALRVPSVRAECLLKFQLRPTIGWDREAIPVCDEEQFVAEASELPMFLDEVDHSKKLWSKQEPQNLGMAEQYPEVVFLGTGSSLPNKTRNVSGTLLNISSSQSVLLDCGEGTFGQLCRHYGDEVDQALSKINTVFISHIHADHHTGLLKLLYERERALSSLGKHFSPVFLLGPDYIMPWLYQYNQACEEILRHVSFISNQSLSAIAEGKRPNSLPLMLKNTGLNKMETSPVRHCKQAFGCSLTHDSGWSLVFSGDTMPCEALVKIGRGATLLIHEATLEDALEEEAMEKRHSTTSQAIDIGMKMNAEFTMLNHFSQRYPKIPLFSSDFSDRVGISFDHMRVRFRDLKLLPSLSPSLKALFAEDITEMKELGEKRARRQADTITADAQSKRLKTQQ